MNRLYIIGFAGFLALAGCHKTVPVAAKATPPVPVAQEAPAAPAPAPAPTPAPQPRAEAAPQPRPTQMTPAERMSLNEHLAKLEDALFDYDRATIRTDATTALQADVSVIRGILSNYPSQKLVIQGGADERGSAEYNLALGDKRARAAEEFLSTSGIPSSQLTIISLGKEHPVCTEQTEACYQRNRRAHITAAP